MEIPFMDQMVRLINNMLILLTDLMVRLINNMVILLTDLMVQQCKGMETLITTTTEVLLSKAVSRENYHTAMGQDIFVLL